MDFQTICRVCTCENSGMLSIFDSCNFSAHNHEIFKVMTACASVQIQKFDGFSEQICRGCLERLSQAYSFKKLCEDSDYKFRNNLIVTSRTELKSEFYVEEIICTENGNCITESPNKSNKITEVGATQPQPGSHPQGETQTQENLWSDAIKTENQSDTNINEEGLSSGVPERQWNYVMKTESKSGGTEEDGPTRLFFSTCNSPDSELKCGLCSKSFAAKKYLALHMELHARQRTQKLFEEADYKFINGFIENNKIELKNEISEEDYVINYGGIRSDIIEISNESNKMTRFELSHDKIEQCNVEIRTRSVPDCSSIGNSPYKCGLCNKSYATKKGLTLHTHSHKPDNTSYNCEVCSKTYETKRSLTLHMHIHKQDRPIKSYVCYTCDKRCTRKDDLVKHIRIHSGEKPYKCDICQKRFRECGNLRKHVRLHSEERPFGCDVCGRRFKQHSNLTKHRVVHSDDKPFKCGLCGKEFNQKLQLVYHAASHTGERQFKCELCDKSFIQKDGLVKHIRSHTGEKPYGCDLCEKKYSRPESLRDHRKKIHSSEAILIL